MGQGGSSILSFLIQMRKKSKKQNTKSDSLGTGISSICPGCSSTLPLLELPLHIHACLQKRLELDRTLCPVVKKKRRVAVPIAPNSPAHNIRLDQTKLSKSAVRALQYVEANATQQHSLALDSLKTRVGMLGYSEVQLHSTLDFIRERAPLIIHIHVPKVLQLLLVDTHYRSLFETGSSSGSNSTESRGAWENLMFGGAYSKAPAAHRVKYGVLNPLASVSGVAAAIHYGRSYLLLKDHLRTRVTFTSKDSGGGRCILGTCKHFAHVLSEFSDPDIKTVISRIESGSESSCWQNEAQYKEMQVHGDIILARDIEALVLVGPEDHKAGRELAAEFGQKFGVSVIMSS